MCRGLTGGCGECRWQTGSCDLAGHAGSSLFMTILLLIFNFQHFEQ